MKRSKLAWLFALAIVMAFTMMTGSAQAGPKYQTTLVPVTTGAQPGFSGSGSSIKIEKSPMTISGKIKKVVDGGGNLVTTDGVPSLDDYKVEVDRVCPATAGSDTVTVSVELKNGNGKFKETVAALCGVAGDGVGIGGVRVKDAVGTLLGVGGITE